MRVGRRFFEVTKSPATAALAFAGRAVAVFGTSGGTSATALLSWNAPTLDESGAAVTVNHYTVYASTNSDDWNLGTFLTPVDTPTNATSYSWQDPAFATGTTWYFWVRAVVTGGAQSTPSQIATHSF
jgi:hypothetical protein